MANFQPGKIPIVGQLGEAFGLWSNPDQDAVSARYADMADAYRQYRRFAGNTLESRLNSQLQVTQPMQQYMSMMMPGMTGFDTRVPLQQFGIAADNLSKISTGNATAGNGQFGMPSINPSEQDARAGINFAVDPLGSAAGHAVGGGVGGELAQAAVNPIGYGIKKLLSLF